MVALDHHAYVFGGAAAAATASILVGYDAGIMSGAILYINDEFSMTTVETETVVSSFNILAGFGTFIASLTADAFGRKFALGVSCIVFLVGGLLMVISTSYWTLLLGRIVSGLGAGAAFVVPPVYIAEIDIGINVGVLLGFVLGVILAYVVPGATLKWRAMLALSLVPPFFILLVLPFLPESPRWLVSVGFHDRARAVVRQISPDEHESEKLYNNLIESYSGRQQPGPDAARSRCGYVRGLVLGEIEGWKGVLMPQDKLTRVTILVGVVMGFLQQASGSEAVVYFTPTLLGGSEHGESSDEQRTRILLGTVLVGIFKLGGEILAATVTDRTGRRPLILLSVVLTSVSLFALALAAGRVSPLEMGTLLAIFMGSFSIGLGPLTFAVCSEIFPLAQRNKAVGLAVFANRVTSGVVALTFLSMASILSVGGAFAFYGLISTASLYFYYRYVPETNGRTLEEISYILSQVFNMKTIPVELSEEEDDATLTLESDEPNTPTDLG